MIPKIKKISPEANYTLYVIFDDGKKGIYDVKEDISSLKGYSVLREQPGLFEQVKLDQSRTCVYWNDDVDLPSDIIYAYLS